MSQRERDSWKVLLADTDLFFFYLRGGKFESQAESVIELAVSEKLELRTSSEVYDDAISAIRASESTLQVAYAFVSDMKSVPHTPLALAAEVAEEAMRMYIEYGGRRKLSYFDSFHVATAKRYDLPFLTSDKYIINHANTLGVSVLNLASWK